jgi:hypothetical protein
MIKRCFLLCALFVLVFSFPLSARAQDAQGDTAPAQPTYSQQQVDQLVAPIALYPDPLLSQVLMASTYPLEVVEASRWLKDPQNAQLQGDQLAAALQDQTWDPSVKSLVNVPQVLSMMDNNLQWTEQLGDAFLAQQANVMDSVQHLRQMAQSSGHLASSPEETVATDNSAISIEPATPDTLYVPYYNPEVVYGTWPYPGYAPYYFPAYNGALYATVGAFGFGFGIGLISQYWGWNHWDWRDHRIAIDDRRYQLINHGFPPQASGYWAHDPVHRRGVPYTSASVRARFQGASNQARGNFRGYAAPAGYSRETSNVQRISAQSPSRIAPNIIRSATPQPVVFHPPSEQRVATPQQSYESSRAEQPAMQQRAAPVFESFSRGNDVQAQSQRGAYSRSTMSSAPRAAPAPRPSNGGGGHSEPTRRQ